METREHTDFLTELRDNLAARSSDLVELPVIQAANPFLDAVGENLRRQIFMTENEAGESLCLRPDFTIPVCLLHIERRAAARKRYSYFGKVFRQDRRGPREILQSGIEDIGDHDSAGADARIIADAYFIIANLLGSEALEVIVGDQAVFQSIVQALDLHPGWQRRLLQSFGKVEQLDGLLNALARPDAEPDLDPQIAALAATGDDQQLIAYIDTVMHNHGHRPGNSRSSSEIAARLRIKLDRSRSPLSEAHLDTLRSFLRIDVPFADAPHVLADFASNAGLHIEDALSLFNKRKEALDINGLKRANIRYQAAFGRPLDYYTGLVFEVLGQRTSAVLAGGGRFDKLLGLLGSRAELPSVGFTLQLEPIQRERELLRS